MSISIAVQARKVNQSKGELSALRKEGWIPCVIYGNNQEPCTLSVLTKPFLKELEKPGIRTRVFNLESFGMALVKEMQFHPTKDIPIHIDFLRLSDRVTVSVPLKFIHEDRSPGMKRGGVLNVIHYALDLSVPSHHIPHELCIDLTGKEIGQTIHLQDVQLPEDSRILHVQQDESIASIVAPSGIVESLKDSA